MNQGDNHNNNAPVFSHGLLFVLVFGVVLIAWGVVAGCYELSIARAQNASMIDRMMTDVEAYPPAYPGLVFLGGLGLVVFVALSAATRFLRRLLKIRLPNGR